MTVQVINRPNIGSSASIEIIDGIEFIGFGSGGFDDDDFLFFGDEVDNIIQAGIGNDGLAGGNGNDILQGGAGNDTLDGDAGNDDLDGQRGTDKLFGGLGNDILRAGGGHDQLHGDLGNDTFGFYDSGFFRVLDFTPGEDRLFFDSETTGLTSIEELLAVITNIDQRFNDDGSVDGVGIEFFNGIATIDLIGVNVNDITPDMIVFEL